MKFCRYICIILLICIFLLFTSCAGLSDWTYRNLPGDYEIVRCNSRDICFSEGEVYGGAILIEETVTAFCYNARFIGLQRVQAVAYEEFDQDKAYASVAEFYLVDAETGKIYGPLIEETYNSKLLSFGITDMGTWISTRTKPDGAE